jgi:hypothetical protein
MNNHQLSITILAQTSYPKFIENGKKIIPHREFSVYDSNRRTITKELYG